jgi:hypothetical protein
MRVRPDVLQHIVAEIHDYYKYHGLKLSYRRIVIRRLHLRKY